MVSFLHDLNQMLPATCAHLLLLQMVARCDAPVSGEQSRPISLAMFHSSYKLLQVILDTLGSELRRYLGIHNSAEDAKATSPFAVEPSRTWPIYLLSPQQPVIQIITTLVPLMILCKRRTIFH